MLTAKENMRETIKPDGHPDRFVNQYEGFQILMHPQQIASGPMPAPGEMNVKNAWGVVNSWPEGQPGLFPEHGPDKLLVKDITTWKDAVHAPEINISDGEWDFWINEWDKVDGDKAYKAAFVVPGMFEQTHHFCSITEVMMYYMINKQEMHDMIAYLLEYELKVAEGICDHLHPTALFHHDDWGTATNSFMRPEMFAEFFVEPYKELYTYYKDHGCELIIHHSDSFCANIVDSMIEIGIDVWQGALRPNNVPELLEKYKGQITFMGNIDNKYVDFEGWTHEDCLQAAHDAMDDFEPHSYIPCICQGNPGAIYPGVYQDLFKTIDEINIERFGCTQEELDNARFEIQDWT